MDPQQPNNQPMPPTTPHSPADSSQPPAYMPPAGYTEPSKAGLHKKLALLFLIGPTALFIIALIGYAITSLITGSPEPSSSTDLFGEQSPLKTAANIILYIIGAGSVLLWLPGIIIGIILLAKKN